ncbi:hypothetical protein Btru_027034 [Bulinus truncatus]|nr:hypothetical protein Btru_027034 [Bulinus truncatus]
MGLGTFGTQLPPIIWFISKKTSVIDWGPQETQEMNEERGSREYRASRPYTYHYDGALFDGPDQYVNLVLSSDGVLQSEVLEDDEENAADDPEGEDSGQTPAPTTSIPSPVSRPPAAVDSAPYHRQASYLAEPRGYIQVTHANKNKSDSRVTVSRSVLELLETLPSLDEPVIQPVPCESEIYNKWARLPRTDQEARGSARSVSVTAKGWTILQSMQNAGPSGPAPTPVKSNPALTALADEECTSLDSIIDHYNQVLLLQSGNYSTVVHHKPGQTDVRRVSEDESESKVLSNKSGRRSPQILNPLTKKTPITNPSSLAVSETSSQGVSPQLTKKATTHQPIPAATASIDWPSDMNNSDKLYQMSRFWSWRPSKTSVKLQKAFTKPSPNPLEKLVEKNQKSVKKDRHNSKANVKKSGPNTVTSDNFLAAGDVKTRPTAAARANNQPTMHFNDNIDDVISTSRPRFLNLKGNSYNAVSDIAHPASRNNDNLSSASQRGAADIPPALKVEADSGRTKPSTRSSTNKSTKMVSTSQTKTSMQPKFRPKLARTAEAGDFKSLAHRTTANDPDLSQVQFLDLTDLNLGQTSRVNNRQKLQKEDFRTLTFTLRGKSSDPKSVN